MTRQLRQLPVRRCPPACCSERERLSSAHHWPISENAQAAESTAPTKALPSAAAPAGTPEDAKAIRATADQFVKAFNSGDAKTIGAEWSTDSEYTDENGVDFHGRAAIEKEYAALFEEQSRARSITVNIASIRFLGPDIAIEKGAASVPNSRRGRRPSPATALSMPAATANGSWSSAATCPMWPPTATISKISNG